MDDRYVSLIARRITREAIVVGRAYVVFARKTSIGVAIMADGRLGYRCVHSKWSHHNLVVEDDRGEYPGNEPLMGTAVPIVAITGRPPSDDASLIAWLNEREAEHASDIEALWAPFHLGTPDWKFPKGSE